MKVQIVKGLLILDKDIYDLDAMYKSHKNVIDSVIDWANKLNLDICFGGLDDHTYGCQYVFDGETKLYIKGLVAELKSMLKSEFPSLKENYQMFGERIS